MTKFRTHRDVVEEMKQGAGSFTAHLLPSDAKRDLCEELLSEFGATNVSVRGDELVHCCVLPWHDDSSPSAQLNFEKLTYNCFSCGSSGGLLWLIGTCRGVGSKEARRWIRDRAGSGESLADLLRILESIGKGDFGGERTQIPVLSDRALDPWMLLHPYLIERGIPEETLVHFRVGYDPVEDRIVIPHFWGGSLCGWQKRVPTDDKEWMRANGIPKYKSSAGMPKDATLFNYDPGAETAIIVEGPMSVLSKYHVSPNMEATFGAEVTRRQTLLIARHPSVILFFDNDQAGWNATAAVGKALLPYSEVWVACNPYDADPADLDDDTYRGCVDRGSVVPWSLWEPPKELVPWIP